MVDKLFGDEFKNEMLRRRVANLVLKGNTYSKKLLIKELGGIWDSVEKAWLMPDHASLLKVGARKVENAEHYEIPRNATQGSPA
jgi:hypothetical protein